jgi:hypothetical protein
MFQKEYLTFQYVKLHQYNQKYLCPKLKGCVNKEEQLSNISIYVIPQSQRDFKWQASARVS